MAISIEEFEATPSQELRPATAGAANAERVVEFLDERRDRAFTPAEIREATGVPRGSVCVVLSRLEDQGRVRHRGAYWAGAARSETTPSSA
ncbi:helix-turn-helix transcriptional regulator [Halosimplex salinum]|uniref:helix-turn-helix transcriptional regulator n=1 Tax=Halosimplex salinum TaxID=1710538 RepID=UPI000F498CFE|nr:MarR family transcriptional regulator [Halosimplex salinum]